MNEFAYSQDTNFSSYLAKCFTWMFFGLLLTAAGGVFLIYSGLLVFTLDPIVLILIMLAEVVVVIFLAARVHKLSASTAKGLFIAYALLNAVTFGLIFLVYDLQSLIFAFAGATVLFGTMALLGYTTSVDLGKIRNILLIGLFSMVIMTVVGVIAGFASADWFILLSGIFGILLFTGLTAYDVQKLKKLQYMDIANKDALVIYGALQLYLDFINLFIYILRLISRNRR